MKTKRRFGLERLKQEFERSDESNVMECDEFNGDQSSESDNSSCSKSSEDPTSKSDNYSRDYSSFDSNEMDEDIENMIEREDVWITDILDIFQTKTENSQKRNFIVETTDDEIGV